MIALIGVGVGLLLSLLTPYIQQALRTRGMPLDQMSFYLNTLSQVRALLHDGSLSLFLVVLFNEQKLRKESL